MKSDFDQMADSRAQHEAERAFNDAHDHAIDTARQSLIRVRRSQRRNIDRYVCSKLFLGLLLAAAALVISVWSHH